MRNLKELGVSVQINTTIARHNAHQLPDVLELARRLGADALHTFLLVPVGCGVDIAPSRWSLLKNTSDVELVLRSIFDR
jgi:AdoMet-dependent heme synthase